MQYEVVIKNIPKEEWHNSIIHFITGTNIDDFVDEVLENKNGKYDCLYENNIQKGQVGESND